MSKSTPSSTGTSAALNGEKCLRSRTAKEHNYQYSVQSVLGVQTEEVKKRNRTVRAKFRYNNL